MTKEILNIILNGLNQAGNYYNCYTVIEEQLPMIVAEEVEQFLAWLEKSDLTIGSDNILFRWEVFNGLPQSIKNKFKLKGGKSHREAIARIRKDITAELVKGNVLDIHSFDYPLKRTTVISYDAQSKVLTLQL